MKNLVQDSKFKIGLVLFIFGFIVFALNLFLTNSLSGSSSFNSADNPIPFFVNFLCFVTFLLVMDRKRFKFPNRHQNILLLLIKVLPKWVEYSLPAIFASGFLFNVYETIYVSPFYPISIGSFWFFGVSLHIFIPLWWTILLGKLTVAYTKKGKPYFNSVLIGLSIPLAIIPIGRIARSQWLFFGEC